MKVFRRGNVLARRKTRKQHKGQEQRVGRKYTGKKGSRTKITQERGHRKRKLNTFVRRKIRIKGVLKKEKEENV